MVSVKPTPKRVVLVMESLVPQANSAKKDPVFPILVMGLPAPKVVAVSKDNATTIPVSILPVLLTLSVKMVSVSKEKLQNPMDKVLATDKVLPKR